MDQNTFINTYIDVIIGTLTDHMKANLQLQTQIKLLEKAVIDHERTIESLNQKISENVIAEDWKQKYHSAETNYNIALGKIRHMDSLVGQITEMKKTIKSLQSKLDETDSPKKVINRKTKAKEEEIKVSPSIDKEIKQQKETDDF